MKRLILDFSFICVLSFSLYPQIRSEYDPQVNLRNGSSHLPEQVDLIWTPPGYDGYGNMIKIYDVGYWQTLMEPDYSPYPWNIGAYFQNNNQKWDI